jgi:hypothetical protein
MYAQIRSGLGLTVMALVLITSACGDGGSPIDPPTPPPAPRVASVSVNPESLALSVGESKQLQVSLFDSSGNPVTGVPIVWTSNNQNVGVNSTGLVTAFTVGESEVKASAGGVSKTVKVTVAPPAPVFEFDPEVSEEDQKVIREGVALAYDFFRASGHPIDFPVTIHGEMEDNNGVAASNQKEVWIWTGTQVWKTFTRADRLREIVYRLYQSVQYQIPLNWFGPRGTPGWLREGSAEMVAYKALSYGVILPYESARGCSIWNVKNAGSPFPTLKSMSEPKDDFLSTPGPILSLAMLAVDQLTDGNIDKLWKYGSIEGDWKNAFKEAFGVSTDAFYDDFEASRTGWEVPSTYECR